MRLYVALALGGLPLGAMYALQAMGIVLVHKTTRTFNFAQGAIGMTAAFTASGLGVSAGVPDVLAVTGGVTVGVGIGLLMERSVRPVDGELRRTIVTLAWLLGLQGLLGWVFGATAGRKVVALFPSGAALDVPSLGVAYSWDQLGVVLVAAVVALSLGIFFRRSDLGVAMRAVANRPDAARLLGVRADRVAQVSWMLGAGLGALSGVLVTPLLGRLDTVTLLVFTVQALAAALVGRLTSLPLTFAGGLALGVVQPVLGRLLGSPAGIDELIAMVVILVALLLRRREGRVDVAAGGLPSFPMGSLPSPAVLRRLAVGGLVVGGALVLALPPQLAYNVADVFVWSLAILSIVLLTGVVGQVSLCQAVFMAVGGFGAGIAVEAGLPTLVALPVGAVLAAAVALLVGLPALRLRGLELAVATLALSFTADRYVYFSVTPLVGTGSTRPVPRPGFADQVVHGVAGARWFVVVTVVTFVGVAAFVAALRRGRTGSALTAMRGSEVATAAVGFSPTWLKLRGFALSGFVAGLAGGLFAALTGAADEASFGFTRSISLVAFALIAGAGSVPGAVIGGGIVVLSTLSFGGGGELSSDTGASIVTMLTGVALAATVVLAPDGVAGVLRRRRAVTGGPPGPGTQAPVDDTADLVGV